MSTLGFGMRTAWDRLEHTATLTAAVFAALFVVVVGLLERHADGALAADRTLSGAAFGIALPLAVYALVQASMLGRPLHTAAAELAHFGGDRRELALGLAATSVAGAAVVGASLAVIAVLAARPLHDPALVADLAASAWIGALGAAAYGGLFVGASGFGARGGGRLWALILDWLLGAGTTALAVPFPRSHILNLLGAPPVLGFPQWGSALSLLLLGVLCVTVGIRRCTP
jgi:hypothetical protein